MAGHFLQQGFEDCLTSYDKSILHLMLGKHDSQELLCIFLLHHYQDAGYDPELFYAPTSKNGNIEDILDIIVAYMGQTKVSDSPPQIMSKREKRINGR